MNSEKKSKKYIKKIVVILLCFCIIIGCVIVIKQLGMLYKKNNNEKQNEIETLKSTVDNNKTIIKKLQNDNIALQNTTVSLGEKVDLLQTELSSLKNYIYKLEQQNPINSEKNLQIMILLNKIQKLYYSNKNFTEELEYLKTLTKNKLNLAELVNELEKYKISKNDVKKVTEVFKNEYKINLLVEKSNKKQNIFKEILINNIKIRKINVDNVDTGDITNKSTLINYIENYISINNFSGVIDLITQNNYNKSVFKKTYEITKRIVDFDNIIDKLINIIISGL